ncbi:MAG: transporter [Burkholderiales bacterium]|jgi:sugar porter (SP) family MFS transporter|nr:transporter [Burkholderiales bacterium]
MTNKITQQYYLLLFLIIVGGITFGYNISVIASSLPRIKTQFLVSEKTISLIAGLVFLGMLSAKLFMAVFNDTYGRRKTLIIAGVIFILGTLAIILSTSIVYIIIGRTLQGFGGGLLMFTTALYIVEIANDNARGKLTGLYQLSFTLGLLISNLIGLFVFDINWKISFGILLVLTVIFIFTIYKLPCSPKWLFMKGHVDEAKRALEISYAQDKIDGVLKSWVQNTDITDELFQKCYLKPLLLVITITCLHQLTGINAILQTSTVLISDAGLAKYAALLSSIGITSVNVIATAIGLKLIDRFPRNLMLGVCGIIIAIAHFIVAMNFFSGLRSPILLLGGLMLFITAYAIGPGIIIWLVFSEYLPTPVRSKAIAIAGFINSLAGFLISSLFLHLSILYGTSWVFLTCSIFSLIYGLIPIFYLPDTAGKNIERLQKSV